MTSKAASKFMNKASLFTYSDNFRGCAQALMKAESRVSLGQESGEINDPTGNYEFCVTKSGTLNVIES